MLWKWHRNCCAKFSGLCYAQNQTRCSLTVFKFSYNKILSCFPFSLNVRNISFQSPATFFFSSREPAFSTEKIQRSFLFSEIYSFLLLALWTMRNDSGCLKSCSHWLEHSHSGCLVRMAPSFLRQPYSLPSQKLPTLCLFCLPFFELGDLSWVRFWAQTSEITQRRSLRQRLGITDYSSYWISEAAAQMPGNLFHGLIYRVTTAVVSLEQMSECVLLKL